MASLTYLFICKTGLSLFRNNTKKLDLSFEINQDLEDKNPSYRIITGYLDLDFWDQFEMWVNGTLFHSLINTVCPHVTGSSYNNGLQKMHCNGELT